MSAQLEELAFQLWMRFGGRSFCATEENLRKNWQSLHSTPYWLQQATELQALGVGVREAEPPPSDNFTALREAAVRANREIDGIRLRVLEKYPSGRGDLSPIGSRSYEVRSFMSAVIRATEDLRRETGMYDGCPNIMPPPAKNEGRGVEPPPPGPTNWRAEYVRLLEVVDAHPDGAALRLMAGRSGKEAPK